ncbi:MAG: hypothetical protein GX443_19105 [Deltaproteobacteria bacterium]|nr:hypothetical protein [Deltaproteobacteria bacterium]
MSYKFNRNCHVKSLEENMFCLHGRRSGEGVEGSRVGGLRAYEKSLESSLGASHSAPLGIEERITGALGLHAGWGETLKGEERIERLMRRLEKNLQVSRRTMGDLGILQTCAECDEKAPEGSCCSRGLEKKYGLVLLLLNLMLGAELPGWRLRRDSCYFLGHRGCMLKVRHPLCVDYLCPQLETTLGREGLMRIQAVSGEEIEAAFLLEEAVKEALRRHLQ